MQARSCFASGVMKTLKESPDFRVETRGYKLIVGDMKRWLPDAQVKEMLEDHSGADLGKSWQKNTSEMRIVHWKNGLNTGVTG